MGSGREEGREGRRCRERGKLYYEGVGGGRDEGEGGATNFKPGRNHFAPRDKGIRGKKGAVEIYRRGTLLLLSLLTTRN